jgi:hypothetical protein
MAETSLGPVVRHLRKLLGSPQACAATDARLLEQYAITADDKTIQLWDAADGAKVRQIKTEQGTLALAFSPDGRTLASANYDSTILVWNATGRFATAPAGPLPAERLPALGANLADKDAGRAFGAVGLLTAGAAEARLTREAKASLQRLAARDW